MNFLKRNISLSLLSVAFIAAILCTNGCSSSTTVGDGHSTTVGDGHSTTVGDGHSTTVGDGHSTTVGDGQSTVTMNSKLTASDVSRAMVVKNDVPSDVNFDSLVVRSVEIFVKDVKLHLEQDGEGKDDHDGTIKTGPFVVIFDSLGSRVVTTAAVIPPGTYDKIKFEIHKPGKNDAADQAVLVNFPEFNGGNENYTVVVHGYTLAAGIRSDFIARSHHTYNLNLKFENGALGDIDNITLGANATSVLLFEFDPRIMFHLTGGLTGGLFDPRDARHQNDIDDDNHLNLALRIIAQ
jgi:hypothetical protein